MAEHNELGLFGEQKAAEYLQSKGFQIRHRNWRRGHLELDIVAENDRYLVIAEVKTRKSLLVGAEESINRSKIRNLVYAANAYIRQFKVMKPTRFDVITIVVDNNGTITSLKHFEDAIVPGMNM
jgi:putative endonuclease